MRQSAWHGAGRRLRRTLLSIGFDPLALLRLRHLPRYWMERERFRKAGGVIAEHYPVLGEFTEQAGSASGHYFHQDLLVAQFVRMAKPLRHVDVGSRIDGFVAHVASFRKIEVIDARPLEDPGHDNIGFIQADLASEAISLEGIADSVSCLHALEHFGLGRYGDAIDPHGHLKGFDNLCRMLKPGGTLYLGVPIGRENRVAFNAHRVFEWREMLKLAKGKLQLLRFDYVDDLGKLHRDWPLADRVPPVAYGCGIYTFGKPATAGAVRGLDDNGAGG